jgi:hypothetical protein
LSPPSSNQAEAPPPSSIAVSFPSIEPTTTQTSDPFAVSVEGKNEKPATSRSGIHPGVIVVLGCLVLGVFAGIFLLIRHKRRGAKSKDDPEKNAGDNNKEKLKRLALFLGLSPHPRAYKMKQSLLRLIRCMLKLKR